MKFSYSFIRKLFPRAPTKAKLIEALTMYSFETGDAAGDVFEASIPPNRYSDAASHLGIAREVAAVAGAVLKNPVKTIVNPPADQGFVKVKVEDKNLCPRYAARYFEINPSVGSGRGEVGSSPAWMQKVLKECGLKPINHIVDLVNYVMLEVGQPLHAFDADRIADRRGLYADKRSKSGLREPALIVRRAKRGERIGTLDGQKLTLDPEVLVIADAKDALAIAGVKGGASSGVSTKTRRIIVEAANFDPVSIYKTSRKLKLMTDAAVRFSHGISPALVAMGLDRVTELLLAAGATLGDSVDVYPHPVGEELIEFDVEKYLFFIGVPVTAAEAKKRFLALGFSIQDADLRGPHADSRRKSQRQSAFLVRIPPWRTDIEEFEDLAEEVSRLVGYNALTPQPPLVHLLPATEADEIVFKDKVRGILANAQLDEVYNSSFVDEEAARTFSLLGPGSGPVEVANPISNDRRHLRASLMPLLLRNVESNARFFDRVRIFEIGKVFGVVGGETKEKLVLGIALAARKEPRAILELKGIVDDLLSGIGVEEASFAPLENRAGYGRNGKNKILSPRGEERTTPPSFLTGFADRGTELLVESGREFLGRLELISLPKGWTAAAGEINLEKALSIAEEKHEFKPLPRFPAVVRDISLLVSREVRIGEVLEMIQDASPKLIDDVDLIDEYVDERFGGKQSLTFRIVFQAEDRTLTDGEVNSEMAKVVAALKKKLRAEVR